jgi:hypothetical protein
LYIDFYEGKNKDKIILVFPLCEGDLMKYLGIDNTKIFKDESKKTFYLGYLFFYVFLGTYSAQSPGAYNTGFKNEAWHIQ